MVNFAGGASCCGLVHLSQTCNMKPTLHAWHLHALYMFAHTLYYLCACAHMHVRTCMCTHAHYTEQNQPHIIWPQSCHTAAQFTHLFFPPLLPIQIEKVLLNYAEQFKMAAYLLPEDVERLIETQGLSANMAVIANKRNYVELCTHIRTG